MDESFDFSKVLAIQDFWRWVGFGSCKRKLLLKRLYSFLPPPPVFSIVFIPKKKIVCYSLSRLHEPLILCPVFSKFSMLLMLTQIKL